MKSRITLLLLATFLVMNAAPSNAQSFENTFRFSVYEEFSYDCGNDTGLPVYTVMLYVHNPVNPDFEALGSRPVQQIDGFECALVEWGNLRLLGAQFPVPAINVGTTANLVVGYSVPIPVVSDGLTILATISYAMLPPSVNQAGISETVETASPQPCDFATSGLYLAPTQFPAIVGSLAYLDADDTNDPLVAASPYSYDYPSFRVDQWPVATEQQSWGSIKSLYR